MHVSDHSSFESISHSVELDVLHRVFAVELNPTKAGTTAEGLPEHLLDQRRWMSSSKRRRAPMKMTCHEPG